MIGRLFDVTVIGSNLSGLIAASLLVKRGFNVLIADVKSNRHCAQVGGYQLGRFHNLLFGFAKDQIFPTIFSELGIPFLDKKRFTLAEPACQVVMPLRRIDVVQDRDDWLSSMKYEFPAEGDAIRSLYSVIDKHGTGIRDFFSHNAIYPVSSIGEKLAARKAFNHSQETLPDSLKRSFSDFLQSAALSDEAGAVVESCLQFLMPTYPDSINLAFASHWLNTTNAGIYHVEGGAKSLEGVFMERITSYRGTYHIADSIEDVHFGKFAEIKFSDQKEAVKTRFVLVADDILSFMQNYAPKQFKSHIKSKIEIAPFRSHDFVLYLGVDESVVPVGMEANVVLVTDPAAELVDENCIFINISNPLDETLAPQGKRLVSARVKVKPSDMALGELEAKKLCERIIRNLKDLIPFLDDFTDLVAMKESYRLYLEERKRAWEWNIDDERLGVGYLGYRTPHKSIYYCGKAILPGLGLEGEAIAARNAANILSDKIGK
jgi:phytoene dehydrogenase-like protein